MGKRLRRVIDNAFGALNSGTLWGPLILPGVFYNWSKSIFFSSKYFRFFHISRAYASGQDHAGFTRDSTQRKISLR